MSVFIPSKLTVVFHAPATKFRPIEGRKYTLTHSDSTGQLFLSIGKEYTYGNLNPQVRDEVVAEWVPKMGEYVLWGRVYVSGGEFDEKYAKVRFLIFQKEMDLALKAIIYGDQTFYTCFPWLLDSPIYIQFDSIYPQYNKIIYMGTPRQYLVSASQQTIS
ncbi:staygreen family protein [Neobacillus sp. PS3-40]|uniref:staygreen family protein n=1 Tax=Neobacillus sp. PS3-40 TaxID=3070679 RepID=UPI0027E169C3|nr:staygreen family protein [Neobacillus sp. PS3-40]WML44500.1 staygreen family protein [Neobacillus sp. PS3-40]